MRKTMCEECFGTGSSLKTESQCEPCQGTGSVLEAAEVIDRFAEDVRKIQESQNEPH